MPETLSDPPKVELFDGTPHAKVSPRLRHAVAQRALASILARLASGRGLVATELRCRLTGTQTGSTSLVPDISYFALERLRALDPEEREEPPFAPDIAVEVRSRSDDLDYLAAKIARYLTCGSVLVLDVDPLARVIFVSDASGVTRFQDGDTVEHCAMPWLRFDVAEVFADQDSLA